MIYLAYQATEDFMRPVRAFATAALQTTNASIARMNGSSATPLLRHAAAGYEMISRMKLSHESPSFGIESVRMGECEVGVTEEDTVVTPFCTLRHFRKDADSGQPRVLLVAPLSGHFATLLRETVRTMLPEHDVYITDWHNARDIPVEAGRFGFEDFVDHLIQFLEVLGPGAHMVAVCQPCPAALVATAIMAQNENPATPKSLTLMAGPVDCRISPTEVNDLATSHSIEWFENFAIGRVPLRYEGGGRQVYPGFVQLASFLSMNMERHVKLHLELRDALANGEHEKANTTKTFYDEYFSVLDLPGEFYLETVEWIFQDFRLPKGEMTYRGEKVDLRAIRRTSLLTVEGERDDICGLGQTLAAQDLCTGIRPYRKSHHMQAGVGHFGVFSGRRWSGEVYPIVRNVILAAE
ncbi:MAG: polyhydroxyalkanoate depolymerase [Dehalococcoidia bacterium]